MSEIKPKPAGAYVSKDEFLLRQANRKKAKPPVTYVASRDTSLLRQVNRALASAGCVVNVCPFEQKKMEEELSQSREMFVIDGDEETTEAGWLYHQLAVRGLSHKAMVLTHVDNHTRVLDLLSDTGVHNFVRKRGERNHSEIDEVELITNAHKLLTGDFFGLERCMATWALDVQRHKIRTIRDKIDALVALDEFLISISCNSRLMPGIAIVAEELMMNAMFGAPRNADGTPKYTKPKKHEDFILASAEEAELTYACDGRYIGIAVADPCGTLTRETIMRFLKHVLRDTKEDDATKGRGARLGMHVVFNSVTQLIFNLDPGVRTEVIAMFYIRGGARAFKANGRSLNVFSREAPAPRSENSFRDAEDDATSGSTTPS